MERVYLNNDWKFSESFTDELVKETYDISKMEDVRIPHNVKEMPYHYFDESIYQMVSGYRKEFEAPVYWKDKAVLITFEGVAHEATVYVNGFEVGKHRCGYTQGCAGGAYGDIRVGEELPGI